MESAKTPVEEEEDPQQQFRVLAYMGASLLPVIALIPFFSSRDFVPMNPADML